MKVSYLLEYLSNADPEADVFIETETHITKITSIVEDKKGLYLTGETGDPHGLHT